MDYSRPIPVIPTCAGAASCASTMLRAYMVSFRANREGSSDRRRAAATIRRQSDGVYRIECGSIDSIGGSASARASGLRSAFAITPLASVNADVPRAAAPAQPRSTSVPRRAARATHARSGRRPSWPCAQACSATSRGHARGPPAPSVLRRSQRVFGVLLRSSLGEYLRIFRRCQRKIRGRASVPKIAGVHGLGPLGRRSRSRRERGDAEGWRPLLDVEGLGER